MSHHRSYSTGPSEPMTEGEALSVVLLIVVAIAVVAALAIFGQ